MSSQTAKKIDKTSNIFDLPLFSSGKEELLAVLRGFLESRGQTRVLMTPNAEQIVQASQDQEFKLSLHQADILIPDGSGVVLASWLLALRGLAKPLKEWIPGVEIVQNLLTIADHQKLPVLVVGGRDYSQGEEIEYQGQRLTWTGGYQHISSPRSEEEDHLRELVARIKPAVVLVAFGAPWQEKWIVDHLPWLKLNQVRLVMAVGGSFDFLLGRVKRAPQWLQQLGLEWLYRLGQQPWRWRRQLRLITFMKLVLVTFVTTRYPATKQ